MRNSSEQIINVFQLDQSDALCERRTTFKVLRVVYTNAKNVEYSDCTVVLDNITYE